MKVRVTEDDQFRYLSYPNFLIMALKEHPTTKAADFDMIADSLPDFKQGVLEAAEFMFQSESKTLDYEVSISSETYGFRMRVRFPFVKGEGEEKKLFQRKRIVDVAILDNVESQDMYPRKWADMAFAKVLLWDLEPFKCDDKW
jgi:hypothetical protein